MMQLTAGEIAAILRSSLTAGHPACLVATLSGDGQVQSGSPRLERLIVELVGSDPAIHGTLGDPSIDQVAIAHALRLMADDRIEIAVADASEIDIPRAGRLLFEISRPSLELIICGGGHVGQALARVARLLDFKVTVIDDRPEFASREKFPDPAVNLIADDFTAALNTLRFTPATHVVIVTRGHKHDEICLRQVIGRPVRYLGMIGSRRRTTTIREHLRREGVEPTLLHRVHAPIGLDIGALTPEEIAVSIVAEMVLVRRGGTGLPKGAAGPMARAR